MIHVHISIHDRPNLYSISQIPYFVSLVSLPCNTSKETLVIPHLSISMYCISSTPYLVVEHDHAKQLQQPAKRPHFPTQLALDGQFPPATPVPPAIATSQRRHAWPGRLAAFAPRLLHGATWPSVKPWSHVAAMCTTTYPPEL